VGVELGRRETKFCSPPETGQERLQPAERPASSADEKGYLMNSNQEEQLIAEVEALKRKVASQAAHILLLLALAKRGNLSHRSDIEEEIDRLPLDFSSDADETRRQAKELFSTYFPRKAA
jgi:hypothetical protein